MLRERLQRRSLNTVGGAAECAKGGSVGGASGPLIWLSKEIIVLRERLWRRSLNTLGCAAECVKRAPLEALS